MSSLSVDDVVQNFDARFLGVDTVTGEEAYDPQILPFVRAMKQKLQDYQEGNAAYTSGKNVRGYLRSNTRGQTRNRSSTLSWWYNDRKVKKPWERFGETGRFNLTLPEKLTRANAAKEYLVYKALLDMIQAKNNNGKRQGGRKKKTALSAAQKKQRAKMLKLQAQVDQLKHDMRYGLDSGVKKGLAKLQILENAIQELTESSTGVGEKADELEQRLLDMKQQEQRMLQEKEDAFLEVDILETEKQVIQRKIESQKQLYDDSKQEYDDALVAYDALQEEIEQLQAKKAHLVQELVNNTEEREKTKFEVMEIIANLSNEVRAVEGEFDRIEPLWSHLYRDKLVEEQKIVLLEEELRKEEERSKKVLEEMARLEKSLKDIMRSNRLAHGDNIADKRDIEALFYKAKQFDPSTKIQPLMARFTAKFYRDEYMDLVKRRLLVSNVTSDEAARLEKNYQDDLEFAARAEQKKRDKLKQQIKDKDDANDDLKSKHWVMERERKATQLLNSELDMKLHQNENEIHKLVRNLDSNPVYDREDVRQDFSRFMTKTFRGDYLKLALNRAVMKALQVYGDCHIVFSDYVSKVNRYNFNQKRLLVITDQGVYNFHPDFTLSRQSRIRDINSISMSRKDTKVFILHHKVDHDYLYLSPKRDEIMYHLFQLYEHATGSVLKYQFGEHLYVADKNMYHRDVDIGKTQSAKVGKSSLFMPLGI